MSRSLNDYRIFQDLDEGRIYPVDLPSLSFSFSDNEEDFVTCTKIIDISMLTRPSRSVAYCVGYVSSVHIVDWLVFSLVNDGKEWVLGESSPANILRGDTIEYDDEVCALLYQWGITDDKSFHDLLDCILRHAPPLATLH